MNDPQVSKLNDNIRQFVKDLCTDEGGNFVITKDTLNQLKVILVASLLEKLAIPIPLIEHEDDSMEVEISNLWIALKDVIPDVVHIELREALGFDTRNLKSGIDVSEENLIIVHALNINYSIKDANIWWRRKKFPKSEDSGMLTMDMPGDGIELRIVLSVKYKDPDYNIFRVKTVDCNIDKLSMKLAGTKHDTLYNLFLTLGKNSIKKKIENTIEEKIADMIELLNGEIARTVVEATKRGQQQIFGSINRALESIKGSGSAMKDAAKQKIEDAKSTNPDLKPKKKKKKNSKKTTKTTDDTTKTTKTTDDTTKTTKTTDETTKTKVADEGSSRSYRQVSSTN